jgi:hypothetical protein
MAAFCDMVIQKGNSIYEKLKKKIINQIIANDFTSTDEGE